LLIANLTPLTFWPPQIRTWLCKTLLTSRFFALSGDRTPGSRSLGLWAWDWINSFSIVIAAALLPVLGVVLPWLLLDFDWRQIEPVAQLLSAGIVGGVAIDVLLIAQLPQLVRPRVYVCFLKRNPVELGTEGFLEEYTQEEILRPGELACLHFRITNTGTSHLSKLDVRMDLPEGFVWAGCPPRGAEGRLSEKLNAWKEGRRVYFPPRDDPLDTAPGASAQYHLLVTPPTVQEQKSYDFRLRIASERSNGFTEKRLWLKVQPVEG
jgi:hypothetical protein